MELLMKLITKIKLQKDVLFYHNQTNYLNIIYTLAINTKEKFCLLTT